ncbi:MAG TPA: hypothetical protein VMA72_07495 [Streptosporangiaceae bacterium]|nr:hypothetical protein [Streptosporangiaceae bacterium]
MTAELRSGYFAEASNPGIPHEVTREPAWAPLADAVVLGEEEA